MTKPPPQARHTQHGGPLEAAVEEWTPTTRQAPQSTRSAGPHAAHATYTQRQVARQLRVDSGKNHAARRRARGARHGAARDAVDARVSAPARLLREGGAAIPSPPTSPTSAATAAAAE